MKGIVLAGGTASRLAPTSFVLNKHLLPIYNKPLIYYPISILMLLGIKDILLTSHDEYIESFQNLLKDGSDFGINISYKIQKEAGGIAEVLLIIEEFIKKDERFCLILGDNIFYIPHIRNNMKGILEIKQGAGILLDDVKDPSRFGIVEFDDYNKIISIEEKPKNPKSHWAVTGIYFYDKRAIEFAKDISRSDRGELEITAINQKYLELNELSYIKMPRGSVWLDAGTPQSMLEASNFVQIIEERQKAKIAVLEEVAYNMGYLTKENLMQSLLRFKKNCEYGKYLFDMINNI